MALTPEFRGRIAKEDTLDFLKDKVVKWWIPDDVVFLARYQRPA